MILWTIQPKIVYDLTVEQGKFYCDGRRAEHLKAEDLDAPFRKAYKWMAEQMRIRGIQVRSYPIWAWYQYPGARKGSRKPSLPRAKWDSALNVESCRIELEVPDEVVLLSDFEMWHCVLNNWCASDDSKEWDLLEAAEKRGIDILPIIQKTWERIFLVDAKNFISFYSGDQIAIQACLPYLDKDWIKKVDHYTVTERSTTYKRFYGIEEEK